MSARKRAERALLSGLKPNTLTIELSGKETFFGFLIQIETPNVQIVDGGHFFNGLNLVGEQAVYINDKFVGRIISTYDPAQSVYVEQSFEPADHVDMIWKEEIERDLSLVDNNSYYR